MPWLLNGKGRLHEFSAKQKFGFPSHLLSSRILHKNANFCNITSTSKCQPIYYLVTINNVKSFLRQINCNFILSLKAKQGKIQIWYQLAVKKYSLSCNYKCSLFASSKNNDFKLLVLSLDSISNLFFIAFAENVFQLFIAIANTPTNHQWTSHQV